MTAGPRFDLAVAPGGYAWWYLDALSDDGQHGLTIIAFIGSVFSPYYAWARERTAGGAAEALNHCAFNVALYGQASHGWAASFSRPGARSRLPGLYLAGGSVHPGPGLPMAALSGRQAAASVMADRPTAHPSSRRSTSPLPPAVTPGGTSTR